MISSIATPWIVLIYGILVAAGGTIGYLTAQSRASLIAGGISGALLVVAAVLMLRGVYQAGWWLALIISFLLLARFVQASYINFKVMPGGIMIVLSLLTLIVLLTIGRNAPVR